MNALHRRSAQRGVSLFDGIAALAILAFGLLALTRFQVKLVGQASEAQQRMVASQLADELLNTMLIDNANAACYTLPAGGGCGSAAATARTTEWRARVLAALPGAMEPTSTLNAGSGALTVTLQWKWTTKDGESAAETRTHTVISDTR
ncbi:MAG: pilus assembly protein PilV [Burkholderiales bacterium]|nr:pilus assembly protein PilV [Burkholderiales bacterium]